MQSRKGFAVLASLQVQQQQACTSLSPERVSISSLFFSRQDDFLLFPSPELWIYELNACTCTQAASERLVAAHTLLLSVVAGAGGGAVGSCLPKWGGWEGSHHDGKREKREEKEFLMILVPGTWELRRAIEKKSVGPEQSAISYAELSLSSLSARESWYPSRCEKRTECSLCLSVWTVCCKR